LTVFEIEKKKKRIEELEKEIEDPNFWKNKEEAIRKTQELASLKKEVNEFEELELELEIAKEEGEEFLENLEKKIKEKELTTFLMGKYDKGDAILEILAGAGGRDSEDWATLLKRMYERYAQRKGFKVEILSQNLGEPGPEGRIGTKSVSMEIKGKYAFGLLKNEHGVHRLVRISPFSAQGLRHTSFALVSVLPKIQNVEDLEIKIRPEDLKIEFFKASGPGGQYVNKRMTAVRITHLPTKITVTCQSERSQAQNKNKALEILYARIYQFLKEKQEKELEKIKGEKISPSWGNQIRSYVLHPYKLVKDLRTQVETTEVEKVLDGELDEFIEAEIRLLK
jgi:peptide chain release factor 2